MMAHGTTDVAVMKDPAKSLGEGISNVDDAGDGEEDNVTKEFPFLDGKELNVDVPGAWGGFRCVDNEYGRGIIFVDRSGVELRKV